MLRRVGRARIARAVLLVSAWGNEGWWGRTGNAAVAADERRALAPVHVSVALTFLFWAFCAQAKLRAARGEKSESGKKSWK